MNFDLKFWFLGLSRKLYNIQDKPSKTTFLLVMKVGEKNNKIREEIL